MIYPNANISSIQSDVKYLYIAKKIPYLDCSR
nr:MAG TPA: hypothetical protein [Caudoviricetes sp.]